MDIDPAALRRARLNAGLTQQQVAARVVKGSSGRVSQWELGQAQPFPRHLALLANVLQVSIADLLVPLERKDLRRLRLEAGMTIGELAATVHVTEPTLRRWEHGSVTEVLQRAPVESLASALGVTAAQVVEALEESKQTSP